MPEPFVNYDPPIEVTEEQIQSVFQDPDDEDFETNCVLCGEPLPEPVDGLWPEVSIIPVRSTYPTTLPAHNRCLPN